MMALCDGALLWCKIHELFAHKSGLFWRIASRKRLITPFDFVDVFISFRRRRPAIAFVILERLTTTSEAFVPAENFRSR